MRRKICCFCWKRTSDFSPSRMLRKERVSVDDEETSSQWPCGSVCQNWHRMSEVSIWMILVSSYRSRTEIAELLLSLDRAIRIGVGRSSKVFASCRRRRDQRLPALSSWLSPFPLNSRTSCRFQMKNWFFILFEQSEGSENALKVRWELHKRLLRWRRRGMEALARKEEPENVDVIISDVNLIN